jgi:hypothetical protein
MNYAATAESRRNWYTMNAFVTNKTSYTTDLSHFMKPSGEKVGIISFVYGEVKAKRSSQCSSYGCND